MRDRTALLATAFVIASMPLLTGCPSLVDAYSRRSEITLKASIHNPVTEGARKEMDVALEMHGSNREVLSVYKAAVEFILEKMKAKP